MKINFILITCAFAAVFGGGCVFSRTRTNSQTPNQNTVQTTESVNNVPVSNAADGAGKISGEIRKVDFKNFTYEPGCAGEDTKKIAVKKGVYEVDKGDEDKMYFSVESITYGDLNGDGDDEAIVLTTCNTGGTGQFTEGFIYGMSDGKPKLLTNLEGGDRADGGLRSAKVENGLLTVESNDAGETGGACCPEFVVTTKYKLEGKNLKQTGAESKKELYPVERVKFAKGASESISKIKIAEIKRFIISARTGQILTVTVDSKDVSIQLLKGEADVSDGKNSLTATLKEDGDYTIQLQNSAEKPTDVTVTIGIE